MQRGNVYNLPISILIMNCLLSYTFTLCVSILFCKMQIYLPFLSLLNNEMAKMIKKTQRIGSYGLYSIIVGSSVGT